MCKYFMVDFGDCDSEIKIKINKRLHQVLKNGLFLHRKVGQVKLINITHLNWFWSLVLAINIYACIVQD